MLSAGRDSMSRDPHCLVLFTYAMDSVKTVFDRVEITPPGQVSGTLLYRVRWRRPGTDRDSEW